MDETQIFARYALAFEQAFASDDWTALGEHFTPDATYETFGAAPLAGCAAGRDAVVARLRGLVGALDRRFDRRVPVVLEGPSARDGGVWIRFALTLERDGLPPLTVTGHHTALLDGARIARLEEYVPAREGEAIAAYLAAHADRLRPARAAALPPPAATMRRVVADYAAAKSRQDVDAALALCSDAFRLETVALGVTAEDAAAARVQLGIFFTAFPDYGVTLEGSAAGEATLAAWGRARLTFAGPLLGMAPTGRTAELPIFCVFTFDGERLAGERFVFDLAELCAQTGLPLDVLRAAAVPEAA